MFFSKQTKSLFPAFLVLTIVISVSAATGFSQILFPEKELAPPVATESAYTMNSSILAKKDIIFTQVIASDSFMSSIAVTNRSAQPYNGSLYFVTGSEGNAWNPIVNGNRITGGMLDVTIQSDSTEAFAVTETVFTVGYAMFLGDDFSLDNYIEGNLTYFSFSGATLLDAVGVPESSEFMVTSLPFDSYADVGLSLAYPDVNGTGSIADLTVILFDENGTSYSNCSFQMEPGEHFSKYLSQLPWNSAPGSGFGPVGKVEITSSVPIAGISMLVTPGSAAGAQISTLPLGGTPLTYEVTFTGQDDLQGEVYKALLTIWIEGYFVNGYMQITSFNGSPRDYSDTIPIIVSGQLFGTELDLTCITEPADTWPTSYTAPAVLYIYIPLFNVNGDIFNQGGQFYHTENWVTPVENYHGSVTLDNTLIK